MNPRPATAAEKAQKHDELMPMLEAMFREFQEFSKKKPEGTLNKRKVEIVNRLLRAIHSIIEGEPNSSFLDFLDEDDLPQNSDVLLVLGQAVAAMESFKKKYYRYDRDRGATIWTISES